MKKNSAKVTVPYLVMTVLFVVCLIVSNLIEIKTVDLGWFTIAAGVVVFPISYIISDCIVEVYGFRKVRLTIWLGFVMSLFVALMLDVALWLPGSADWRGQAAMEATYGSVPRMMAASFTAFIVGAMANAYIMSRLKARSAVTSRNSRRSFSVRAIVSTLLGEGIDSLIFFPIAFGGVLPVRTIMSLIVTQVLLKTAYEIVALPLTITVVNRLKKVEGIDTVDDADTDYRPWRIADV